MINLTNCLNSLFFNFYHLAASGVGQLTGLVDANLHLIEAQFHASQGYNNLYRLIGSTSVPTTNLPIVKIRTSKNIDEITQTAKKILENHALKAYLEFRPLPSFNWQKGICQGMVTEFICRYHLERAKGKSVECAAITSATLFTKGGTLFSCAIQYLYASLEIDEKKFDLEFPPVAYSIDVHGIEYITACPRESHHAVGARSTSTVAFSSKTVSNFTALSDGCYDVTVGKWSTKTEGSTRYYEQSSGHANALIIDQGTYFIFNPHFGLFKADQPEAHFRGQCESDNNRILYTQVQY